MGERDAPAPHAAILLIGDELLTGKIRDQNGYFLARLLRRRGVGLREIATVGDGIDAIVQALRRLCDAAPLVFTSGGVGPTHDDRTLAAVSQAFGRPLRRHPVMEDLLRRHYGEAINPAALGMADLPEGTTLRALPGWPVLRLDLDHACIYMLPGVPELFQAKLEQLERIPGELPAGETWHLTWLHTDLDESTLAPLLDRVVADYPGVDMGSYPRWIRTGDGHIRGHVRVTFEAPRSHTATVEAAREALRRALPTGSIIEPPPDTDP